MDTNLILLIGPMIIALVMLIAPQWQLRRIEARIQAGNDHYLDEQRSYRAYPWQSNANALRVMGAVILALEALYLGLSLLPA